MLKIIGDLLSLSSWLAFTVVSVCVAKATLFDGGLSLGGFLVSLLPLPMLTVSGNLRVQ